MVEPECQLEEVVEGVLVTIAIVHHLHLEATAIGITIIIATATTTIYPRLLFPTATATTLGNPKKPTPPAATRTKRRNMTTMAKTTMPIIVPTLLPRKTAGTTVDEGVGVASAVGVRHEGAVVVARETSAVIMIPAMTTIRTIAAVDEEVAVVRAVGAVPVGVGVGAENARGEGGRRVPVLVEDRTTIRRGRWMSNTWKGLVGCDGMECNAMHEVPLLMLECCLRTLGRKSE